MRILIVDDRKEDLYLLETMLKGYGYKVVTAANGAEALEAAGRDPPDMIISDILMPVMDGFTLCREWKRDKELKESPFVFYTATYTDPKDEEFALSLGADRFIVKPTEPDVFVGMLQEVIREAEEGWLVAPREPVEEEPVFLKEYSERLVRKLEKKVLDLEREIAERRRAEEALRKQTHDLGERVKELNCLYRVSEIVEEPGILLEGILQGTVDLIPSACQYPEITCARITLEGQEFATENFRETTWKQTDDIVVHGERIGSLKVCYLEERPESDEGPFLKEERSLVKAIVERLGRITERKRAGEALQESELRYRTLFESTPVGIGLATLDGQILTYNNTMLQITGYSGAEFGQVNLGDTYQNPGERALLLKQLQTDGFVRDFEATLKHKDGTSYYASLTITPLTLGGEDALLTAVKDITERKQAEEELQRSFEKLQRTFEGTVHTLVSAIETRDPYTAGHQRRVTQLACAIAEEMGLPEERIEGLRMAGLVHDLGKITVPAEILSKLGRLNDLQYGLIQVHAQVGHDVLKEIDYPWPVAQIVLQHHERLDGSGYPQGLSGEEILLEARILAVADVVEAMASHRPYRPPRGLDEALEEISQNRGVLYDPEVVDVCLKLFTEKGFTFE